MRSFWTKPLACVRSSPSRSKQVGRELIQTGHTHVVEHRHHEHQPLLFAVLRQEPHAGPDGCLRRLDVRFLAKDDDAARVYRIGAEDRTHQLRSSGAYQSGNA